MPTRKTSLTMDADLLDEAREYGINISAAASSGLESVVKAERQRRWQNENRAWIDDYNRIVETHGLPLAKHRAFRPED
ncbi:MAG: type II toxin-antitoxin system CcdA family antitoxin [Pseudomonadota bacterium]